MKRGLSLVDRVGLVAAAVAALVGILFATSLVAIASLRRAESRESHSREVTVAALQVRSDTAELESSLRGYVLSGNPRFVASFQAAKKRTPFDLTRLRRLVEDDAQRDRARRITADLEGYLSDYAQNVFVIAQIQRAAARGGAASNEGKRRTDVIRAELGALLTAESAIATRAAERARNVAQLAVVVGIAALAISTIVVLIFGAWVARRVAAPVRRVSAAAADVAAGDLSVRLAPGGAAEVATLVEAFNSMTRALDASHDELLLQNEQLRESERQKRDLISMVSHELRTPLSAVLGFTTLLLERDFPPEEQRRYLEIIDAQAHRLAALAGDFLDVRLLEGGGMTIVRAPLDLARLVRDQTRVFFPRTDASHELYLDVDGGPVMIDGDHDRLAQVVGNLLSNALKYAPPRSLVRVAVGESGEHAIVEVADQGIGVAPDETERIFEKFFRSDAVATTVPGTGLGLAVAREIVVSHGGSLTVRPTDGGGATFVLRLPLRARSATATVGNADRGAV